MPMQEDILKQPIENLGLSQSFTEMAFNHGFKTLEDILNWPVNILLKHNGFTYHHYHELRNFLKERNSIHLLRN